MKWQSPGLGKSGLCFMFYNILEKEGASIFDTPSFFRPITQAIPSISGHEAAGSWGGVLVVPLECELCSFEGEYCYGCGVYCVGFLDAPDDVYVGESGEDLG